MEKSRENCIVWPRLVDIQHDELSKRERQEVRKMEKEASWGGDGVGEGGKVEEEEEGASVYLRIE